MKYYLSDRYETFSEDGCHFLNDTLHNRRYVINLSIYTLLENFKNPISKNDCLKNILTNELLINPQIKEKYNVFIKDLEDKKILVKYDTEKIHDKEILPVVDIDHIRKKFNLDQVIHQSSKSIVGICRINNRPLVIKIPTKGKHITGFIENEKKILDKLNKTGITARKIPSKYKECITLEYLSGYKSLPDFFKENKIGTQQKTIIVNNIIKVYLKLFNLRIYHNDIHFNNIMINNSFKIKIIDFEHSHFHNSTIEDSYKAGVNRFIPPERIGNSSLKKIKNYTSKEGEVYQLGLIFYSFYKENFPFYGNTWNELKKSIENFNFSIDKETIINDLDHKTFIFLKKAIDINPDRRFKNIQEMYNFYKQNIYYYEKKN